MVSCKLARLGGTVWPLADASFDFVTWLELTWVGSTVWPGLNVPLCCFVIRRRRAQAAGWAPVRWTSTRAARTSRATPLAPASTRAEFTQKWCLTWIAAPKMAQIEGVALKRDRRRQRLRAQQQQLVNRQPTGCTPCRQVLLASDAYIAIGRQ